MEKPIDENGAKRILKDFYTGTYQREKHDSPEKSRISMIRQIMEILQEGIPVNKVLNIGSGRQSLEKQLHLRSDASLKFLRTFRFFTVDIARLSKKQLLSGPKRNTYHSQADGVRLPMGDNSFGLIVSNFAIDFMSRKAFVEAQRILAPEGRAIFFFHHPDIEPDLTHPEVAKFWSYLRTNQPPFENEEVISLNLKWQVWNQGKSH